MKTIVLLCLMQTLLLGNAFSAQDSNISGDTPAALPSQAAGNTSPAQPAPCQQTQNSKPSSKHKNITPRIIDLRKKVAKKAAETTTNKNNVIISKPKEKIAPEPPSEIPSLNRIRPGIPPRAKEPNKFP